MYVSTHAINIYYMTLLSPAHPQPPVEPNGPIIDYTIQYRLLRQRNDVDYTTVSVGSGTAQTYILTGLTPLERSVSGTHTLSLACS